MNREERKAWLESLKDGDEVCIRTIGYGGRSTYELVNVQRVTATQFVLANDRRVRREDGALRGDTEHRSIEPVVQKVRDNIEQARLTRWLANVPAGSLNGWRDPPLRVLRAMKAAYDAETAAIERERAEATA